ncbi:MAG TPA: sugar ABC transporter ATP-binding protein [Anaeromyxobacteraceae bacterium]|nr:sugar ABC transporter ATP-binding protein [Anaeromyxobacteraceae bacterium]
MLEADGVAKSFGGVAALKNGRLTLQPGTVHALCGGNGAGKSTLLNIIMGLLRRDAGLIRVKGEPVDFHGPAQALAHGLAIITQELSPVRGMTVAENIYLHREPRRARFVVNYRKLYDDAEALLQRLRFRVDPRARMSELSLAQTQLVEIAKAISQDSAILIMDEPTSAIGEAETDTLFEAIRHLTAGGTGIIYVSHRLTEIFRIADHYTVLRDGAFVETGAIRDIDRAHMVRLIVGREMTEEFETQVRGEVQDAPMLEVTHLSRPGEFEDVSLDVRKGEIVGIFGLMGSGRSEFLHALYGLTHASGGEIRLEGRALAARAPGDAIAAGVALVTEDRKDTGLFLSASLRHNVTIASLRGLSRLAVVNRSQERKVVSRLVDRFRIKAASQEVPVSSMSGGNQQKVVLARCATTRPRLLLCDEPTRGVDVGAKREVHEFLAEFARGGGSAIVVSSETPEILAISDRIVVFRNGRVAARLDAREATQERLLHLAS